MTRGGEDHHPAAATNAESDEETTLVVIVFLLLTKPKIYSSLRLPQYFLSKTVFSSTDILPYFLFLIC